MKIQTTEAVRRFNAQVELADLTICKELSLDSISIPDPSGLFHALLLLGHYELAGSLKLAGTPLGYFPERCQPTDAAGQPGQTPHTGQVESTKSVCKHLNMTVNDAPDQGLYAWKCADCGYVYGKGGMTPQTTPKDGTKSDVLKDIADSFARSGTADFDGHADLENLLHRAGQEMREMRTTLKQCRKAILRLTASVLDGESSGLNAVLNRINSIIPSSEV